MLFNDADFVLIWKGSMVLFNARIGNFICKLNCVFRLMYEPTNRVQCHIITYYRVMIYLKMKETKMKNKIPPLDFVHVEARLSRQKRKEKKK